MPSRNILQSVNLSVSSERRGVSGGCPNPALNPSASCGTNLLTYTVLSFDESAQKWYPANQFGFYTSSVSTAGTVTGSAYLLNLNQNGCIYPAIYLSGSLTVPLNSGQAYLTAVTGNFTLTGGDTGAGTSWYLGIKVENTASVDLQIGNGGGAQAFHYDTMTAKNSIVGVKLGNYTSPFNRREVSLQISGSLYAINPPYTNFGYPATLGTYVTLSGVGIIRSFGNESGSVAQQTQYNCLYGSTPTK